MRISSYFEQAPAAEDAPRLPPGPRGLPLVGSFLEARRDVLSMLERGTRDFGPVVRYRFGAWNMAVVQRPEDVRHVLVQNHKNYRKSPSYDVLRSVLGQGLLTSEGEHWRRQRRLVQPPFHHKSLVSFTETMGRLALEVADAWARGPDVFDVHDEMMQLTLRIVGHTLMSTELSGDADRLGAALGEVLDYAKNVEAMLLLPEWLPTVARVRARRAIAELDDIVLSLIAERRQQIAPPQDLLTMLIAATDDGAGGMSDRQLRDEVLTLILAGHETTANALSWTWHLLSHHPEARRKLEAELDEVVGEGPVAFADLDRLTYTEAVIKESMRLYPPAWMFERQALGDDRLGGYDIPAGWLVGISPWISHRNEELYPNPEAFDPQRFLGEAATRRPRYAYLPFGAGPRTCIGNAFAIMEAKIIVATLASRFRLTVLPGQAIRPEPGVTLRPERGIAVSVAHR